MKETITASTDLFLQFEYFQYMTQNMYDDIKQGFINGMKEVQVNKEDYNKMIEDFNKNKSL